ncbi:MAG: chemotaxis protein CheR [Balneola sp.]|jgi:chemotaxis protein methyltransferase CheR|nr:chemotaxis protein CheR [Balneola sp.]MBE79139.1 chemotaxis protein CheR [Balneola sp.]|tara:strand:+ start:7740 stop:8573 length:834 start_codon:yes stop_codon:yes gene_type:complete
MKAFAQLSNSVSTPKLTMADFHRVQEIIYDYCGISINEGKEALVQSRLMRRMRKLGIGNFSQYLDFIQRPESGAEFLSFVDVLTTNKTSFFRESQHFDFINKVVMPKMAGRNIKWWSAGCSSGEEPITTAITMLEAKHKSPWSSAKILATDLSQEVLHIAKNGVYPGSRMNDIPNRLQEKYFGEIERDQYQVSPEVMNMITYGRLNLLADWPLKGNFQVIMCRNVMIYFNRETQQKVVDKFYDQLEPGGYLFLGHSESVSSNNKGFKNMAPAVYQKI